MSVGFRGFVQDYVEKEEHLEELENIEKCKTEELDKIKNEIIDAIKEGKKEKICKYYGKCFVNSNLKDRVCPDNYKKCKIYKREKILKIIVKLLNNEFDSISREIAIREEMKKNEH